jgi:transmembrane 9 superfamily protein 2/4
MRSLAAVALLAMAAQAYYLPGIEPVSYKEGDDVEVIANGLHSVTALMPFGYYKLPFCQPPAIETRHETLGEVLMGDRMETSPYTFRMNVDTKCQVVPCGAATGVAMDAEKLKEFEGMVEANYRAFLVLDNLPVFNNGSLINNGRCEKIAKANQYEFLRGYAIGVRKTCTGAKTHINNHVHFRIQYHRPEADPTSFRVVGFTAIPASFAHTEAGGKVTSCNDKAFDMFGGSPVTTADTTKKVIYTYGVTWVEEPGIRWASRWDSYLHSSFADTNTRVHWLSIINSMLVIFCLAFVTFGVLVRALRKDFAKYNDVLSKLESAETAADESGWKNVHREVLQAPLSVERLIVCVASGLQILGMCSCTLFFAVLGFLSPANRGALLTALILSFVVQAFVAGYSAARMLRTFVSDGKTWGPVVRTAFVLPGAGFAIFFAANLVNFNAKASTAMPFSTLALLLAIWLCISVPLVVLGAAFGFAVEATVVTGKSGSDAEMRPIPEQPWYLQDVFCALVPAFVPFAAVFLELRFILASLWQGIVYYVFGFLTLTFILWLVGIALTSVIVTYYRLCAENHRWWWMAFITPGALGVHLMLYSVYYLHAQLSMQSRSAMILYYLYMLLLTVAYVLMSGAVGFATSYLFIRKIYAAIKLD